MILSSPIFPVFTSCLIFLELRIPFILLALALPGSFLGLRACKCVCLFTFGKLSANGLLVKKYDKSGSGWLPKEKLISTMSRLSILKNIATSVKTLTIKPQNQWQVRIWTCKWCWKNMILKVSPLQSQMANIQENVLTIPRLKLWPKCHRKPNSSLLSKDHSRFQNWSSSFKASTIFVASSRTIPMLNVVWKWQTACENRSNATENCSRKRRQSRQNNRQLEIFSSKNQSWVSHRAWFLSNFSSSFKVPLIPSIMFFNV